MILFAYYTHCYWYQLYYTVYFMYIDHIWYTDLVLII